MKTVIAYWIAILLILVGAIREAVLHDWAGAFGLLLVAIIIGQESFELICARELQVGKAKIKSLHEDIDARR